MKIMSLRQFAVFITRHLRGNVLSRFFNAQGEQVHYKYRVFVSTHQPLSLTTVITAFTSYESPLALKGTHPYQSRHKFCTSFFTDYFPNGKKRLSIKQDKGAVAHFRSYEAASEEVDIMMRTGRKCAEMWVTRGNINMVGVGKCCILSVKEKKNITCKQKEAGLHRY